MKKMPRILVDLKLSLDPFLKIPLAQKTKYRSNFPNKRFFTDRLHRSSAITTIYFIAKDDEPEAVVFMMII